MMDAVSEARLLRVHPQLANKIRALNGKFVSNHPSDYLLVEQGLRTWDQQAALWAQGRTTPGKIVTDAPPGHSWHEFGMACDVCPNSLIGTTNWSPESPLWAELSQIGQELGMFSGACFHRQDRPHFQLTGRFPVSPDHEIRQIYENSGLIAVWQEAGINEEVV